MASKLIGDLKQIPNIVGGLGLAMAEAQKAFNEDYIRSLDKLAVIARSFMGTTGTPADLDTFVKHLVMTAAPTRYQFTETTLSVKLDLAESRDSAIEGGLGFGFAGVVVNAAFSSGFSQDYRAAAEVRTTIHAVLPGENVHAFDALLSRAKEISTDKLTLPERSVLDQAVIGAMTDAAGRFGFVPAPIKAPEPKKEVAGGK